MGDFLAFLPCADSVMYELRLSLPSDYPFILELLLCLRIRYSVFVGRHKETAAYYRTGCTSYERFI
jgi:hypothetical protein